MLTFYTTPDLVKPISILAPKVFSVPLEGGTRTSRLYLANTYTCKATANLTAGASTIAVDQTLEFLDSGKAIILGPAGSIEISYAGKTANSLTGVTGVTSAFSTGTSIKPSLAYVS